MAATEKLEKFKEVVALIWIDTALLGFCLFAITEKPARWPFLFVILPLIVVSNVVGIRKIRRSRFPSLTTLIYVCGLFGLAYSMLLDFRWWKLMLILLTVLLLAISMLHRTRLQKSRAQLP